ncbi:MAG: hypothetical protein ACOC4M_17285, partial [Promethearchaeia archaeon]
INTHYAIGVVIASITHYFCGLTLFQFLFIVLCSFIMDFDIFFSKYAQDNNHRMLISHSIIPSLILIVLGIFFFLPTLLIGGITYFIHIVIDSCDWGTNFCGFHEKPFGPKFLISREELDNLSEILKGFKVDKSFFDFKYYKNRLILGIEIIVFIVMVCMLFLFAIEFGYFVIFYFPLLLFHIFGHISLKKIEANVD